MPATPHTQFRLTPDELAKLDAIARQWGPTKPLTRTDAVRVMIDRTFANLKTRKPRPSTSKRSQP